MLGDERSLPHMLALASAIAVHGFPHEEGNPVYWACQLERALLENDSRTTQKIWVDNHDFNY